MYGVLAYSLIMTMVKKEVFFQSRSSVFAFIDILKSILVQPTKAFSLGLGPMCLFLISKQMKNIM